MTEHYHVFLSYSRNDLDAAVELRGQLDRCGLSVFKDDDGIRAGDLWLGRLQDAIDGCGAFVVLVGRDGGNPDARHVGVGFRVVCLSPSLDTDH